MPNDLSGEALREAFFTTCCGWKRDRDIGDITPVWVDRDGSLQVDMPPVESDANACEAWAMRWSRQANLRYEICEMQDHVLVVLVNFERDLFDARGADWKQAFVRACVAAGEALNQSRGGV